MDGETIGRVQSIKQSLFYLSEQKSALKFKLIQIAYVLI